MVVWVLWVLLSADSVLVGVLAFFGAGCRNFMWPPVVGGVWLGHAVGFTFNTCVVGVVPPCDCSAVWWGGCVVGGLFVNCIVVVSIFSVFLFCVILLFSFCGHSVDALAPRADEGRCGLRYASGSWRASV